MFNDSWVRVGANLMRATGELGAVAVLLVAGCRDAEEVPEVGLEEMGYRVTGEDFHRAAEIGDVAVLRKMLEEGVELGVRDVAGDTALHAAAAAGSERGVSFMVERGLDVDVRGGAGRTPLMVAAVANEPASLRELLRLGAKPELEDVDGYRALTIAADLGCVDAAEVLAVSSRPFLDDALLLACLRGHSGCVAVLADYGGSVYARLEDGSTPLMLAAREGHGVVVEVLLERGANRFAVDLEERTAGQIAMESGHAQLAARLNAAPGAEAFRLPEMPELVEADEVPAEEAGHVAGHESAARGFVLETGHLPGSGASDGQEGRPGERLERSPADAEVGRASGRKVPGDGGRTTVGGEVGQSNLPESGDAEVSEATGLVMEHYEEKPLPLRIEGVAVDQVRVRYLYGENDELIVKKGEVIPLTGLRVVEVEQKRDHSKVTGGVPEDVSVVVVEDPGTGQRRRLTVKLGASAHEPFAVLRAGKAGDPVVARVGAVLRGVDERRYRVMDVRPAQVVLEDVDDERVVTLKLQKNQWTTR